MDGAAFHPAVSDWFREHVGTPSAPQRLGWPSIAAGKSTLIAAPTGSGKTLAAFMAALDELVRAGLAGSLEERVQVLYVSPLKALSNDIEKNLQLPLAGIKDSLRARGLPEIEIRSLVRTGDTPAKERARLSKHPPHLLVTTPESLYVLLTSQSGREALKNVRSVIVDEIHALVGSKRGAHLALSLERLEALTRRAQRDAGEREPRALVRIGLSATQRPIEEVGRFLVGARPPPSIVDCGHQRELRLALELPRSPLEAVMSHEVWSEVYDRIAELVAQNRTTLVFVGNRRMAERLCRHLGERLGVELVAAHHGSLSKERRLRAETQLKAGELKALVATASLELGIDVGSVDLVCQIGSTRGIAQLLQRVGRSGHQHGGIPDGRLFPLSRNDLLECTALLASVRRGELDRVNVVGASLDILAQQIVASAANEDFDEAELFELVTRAYPYRELERTRFDSVLQMLAEGFDPRRGSRRALVRWDRSTRRVAGRKAARLVALTSGGAIADTADYRVVLEPDDVHVGSVHEDFAIEAMAGDIFQLGNASWRILKVETGLVRVADAKGQPPTIPFWLGEAPARTDELSRSVSDLRRRAGELLGDHPDPAATERCAAWLQRELGMPEEGARQLGEYLAESVRALGCLPTQEQLVMERFFDEAGNTHLVIHSPYGARLNRAWGLALRKRFCRSFNFELQAAASEDAIILSLGPTHSFELDEVKRFLHSNSAEQVLVQALLDAPMFEVRWRHNAARSLATPRQRGGKRVPAFLLRIQADDLLSTAFPDAQACLENIAGDREIPEHPLVQQTIEDCLGEAMDSRGLTALLARLERGEIELLARDLPEPSPLAHEILNANPYAFLDPAPLEERRTQAVFTRRAFGGAKPDELGALDPAAIERVRAEAWPSFESREELFDALCLAAFIALGELEPEQQSRAETWMAELCDAGRATRARPFERELWLAAPRLSEFRAAFPQLSEDPALALPPALERKPEPSDALRELVRGRLESLGPVTLTSLAGGFGVNPGIEARVERALLELQAEGVAMLGHFTAGVTDKQWCERGLLARIHRATIDRLQREIEPVSSAAFMRFLVQWHHLAEPHQLRGPRSLQSVLAQLEGFRAAAGAWESALLPARLGDYQSGWLDAACLRGEIVWGRLGAPSQSSRSLPSTPLCVATREAWAWLSTDTPQVELAGLSANARKLTHHLAQRGACFLQELQRLVPTRSELEAALSELVARGLVSSDGFSGVRALLSGNKPRPLRRRRAPEDNGLESAGRWSLLAPDATIAALLASRERVNEAHAAGEPPAPHASLSLQEEQISAWAKLLLRRYGVVFRAVLEREAAPPWRDLLREFRRLEARGEVRGGRFVQRHAGEQFALPETIPLLRKQRHGELAAENEHADLAAGEHLEEIVLSACDPLNLVGSVLPGDKIAANPSNRLLLRSGLAIAALEGGKLRCLVELGEVEQQRVLGLLRRGPAAAPPSKLVGMRRASRTLTSDAAPPAPDPATLN